MPKTISEVDFRRRCERIDEETLSRSEQCLSSTFALSLLALLSEVLIVLGFTKKASLAHNGVFGTNHPFHQEKARYDSC